MISFNLILILVTVALYKKVRDTAGFWITILAGLLFDLFSGEILGVNALSLLLIFLLINWLITKVIAVSDNNVFIFSLILFFSTFIFRAVHGTIVAIISKQSFSDFLNNLTYYFTHRFLLEGVYNIILFCVIILVPYLIKKFKNGF